jgi:hypothetical protein
VPTGKFCLAKVAFWAARREVGAYASFKKLPSGLLLVLLDHDSLGTTIREGVDHNWQLMVTFNKLN